MNETPQGKHLNDDHSPRRHVFETRYRQKLFTYKRISRKNHKFFCLVAINMQLNCLEYNFVCYVIKDIYFLFYICI